MKKRSNNPLQRTAKKRAQLSSSVGLENDLQVRHLQSIFATMKSKAEIEAALPALKTEDLHHIECEIRRLYRHRGDRVLYDDAYGVWLVDDQVSAAAEVFGMIEAGEAEDGRSQPR